MLPYVSLYSCIEIIKRIIKQRIEKVCLTSFNIVPAVKFYSGLLTMYVDLYNNKIWILFKGIEYTERKRFKIFRLIDSESFSNSTNLGSVGCGSIDTK